MPTYNFENTETGEVQELVMTMANKDKYLTENPHIKQVILAMPRIVRNVGLTGVKTDSGFKEALAKVNEKLPVNNIPKRLL